MRFRYDFREIVLHDYQEVIADHERKSYAKSSQEIWEQEILAYTILLN